MIQSLSSLRFQPFFCLGRNLPVPSRPNSDPNVQRFQTMAPRYTGLWISLPIREVFQAKPPGEGMPSLLNRDAM